MKTEITERLNEKGYGIYYQATLVESERIINCGLSGNTYRAFWRIDKTTSGASHIFREYFRKELQRISSECEGLSTRLEFDEYLDDITADIEISLKNNIQQDKLASYNRLRKPVDIMIEHLISMDSVFNSTRSKIIPWLFLPLDSWIFQSEYLFPDQTLSQLGLSRRSSFGDVQSKSHYIKIQDYIKDRAAVLGVNHEIYFDLLWNNRLQREGKNLFELNS
ncbi:hypothetical protein OAE48_02870 [Flavobacteriales bacterium]|nr:hypothetical protein [Flavobacteriales bacterium]